MTVRNPQRWICPKCGWRYESPIDVHEALCPNHRGRFVTMKPDVNEGDGT